MLFEYMEEYTEWFKTTENQLKHSVEPWSKYINSNNKKKVVLNQFRVGHTIFSYGQNLTKAINEFNIPDSLYKAICPLSN